ncbi:hypothetical protein [Ureibacillus chungkukjangi]|uniref:Aminopeptidase n=1 Tax=Ureibacillus chungkukjangi TaxID=1202712 RepID=A0A318TU76_9BACL|nr:hypothetical protein [Ureibacillus chungkukjangi]PYF08406.1 hypothetical protein BJ095_102172 [Ureibacillus chungkukjangi]
MKIIDTFSAFPEELSLDLLRQYYAKYPQIFNTYFLYHCKDTDERLNKAIEKYADDWESIEKVHHSIKDLIEEVVGHYKEKYQIEFPVSVNLIIGAYGSNAYTHREIIPDLTFAMERLSFEENPLRVIIAHEFGHAAHNIISDAHQIEWKNIQWTHPFITLLQEGAATHFSRQIIPDLKESIYFSYDNEGDEWLGFAKANREKIIRCFANDIDNGKTSIEIFKEWFSINGGVTFGYSRLAYFIADCFFQYSIKQTSELDTLLLWKNERYFEVIDEWLKSYKIAEN